MPKSVNPFEDYVNSLNEEEFLKLQEAIFLRIDRSKYGYCSFEEAAVYYNRHPICPKCDSLNYTKDGFTRANHARFRCKECGTSYTLLSNSIFNSNKITFSKFMSYISLMSYNVPLETLKEVLDISTNTAELWRKKIFETVNGYQEHLILSDNVWIDETYLEDYEVMAIKHGKHLRGLSKSKICITVAIDSNKNMVAIISGHGKPTSRRISKVLKPHIKEGSNIIHDGDFSHLQLIKELNCTEEFYKANVKDEEYETHMALINNMCSWLKRYLRRFVGMDLRNLQGYLNWFIYLQRVKQYDEKWPKNTRILRHLLLSEAKFTRKY